MKVGVVAPGSRIEPATAEAVFEIAHTSFAGDAIDLVFHPQCFSSSGHFAGTDAERLEAFLDIANDPAFDVLWFARGGYGSCRILEDLMPRLSESARSKTYLGYSDAGFILAALYANRIGRPVHGPMPSDVKRADGGTAIQRTLSYLLTSDRAALEPSLQTEGGAVAFNMTVLSQLLGTAFEPDLSGQVLMLEEVAEQLYRIDRSLFHITSNPMVRRVAGIRLGRCSDVPPNVPEFGQSEEAIVRHWCAQAGIKFLGTADIGHDIRNKIVPFGSL